MHCGGHCDLLCGISSAQQSNIMCWAVELISNRKLWYYVFILPAPTSVNLDSNCIDIGHPICSQHMNCGGHYDLLWGISSVQQSTAHVIIMSIACLYIIMSISYRKISLAWLDRTIAQVRNIITIFHDTESDWATHSSRGRQLQYDR